MSSLSLWTKNPEKYFLACYTRTIWKIGYLSGFYTQCVLCALDEPQEPKRVCLFSDPDRISSHLTSAIVQAHNSTIYISSQDIREKCRMGIDQAKLFTFKNMVRQDCFGVCKRFSTLFLISVARGSVGNSCSRIDQHHQTDYWIC